MRRYLVTILMLLILSACAPSRPDEAPHVVVTIPPLYGLAASLMEGVATPELLIEGGMSPHSFQFRPSQMRMMTSADLVFWMGAGLEMPLADVVAGLGGDTVVLELGVLEGLTLLPAREGGVWAAHHHDEDGDHEEGHEGHDHGMYDPHLWLDPRNGIAMARAMAAALMEADPGNAERYQQNLAALEARLGQLDAELAGRLAPFADAPYLTYHDAYQYFERRYGLQAAGTVTLDADRLPGARTVMDLHDMIAARGVVCVFSEPQFEPRMVSILIEGTGARTGTLDPLGAELPLSPLVYDQLLQSLADHFIQCMDQ